TDPAGAVRAPTVLGVIQELRNAGAEVIQVGGVRVVASSAGASLPAGGGAVDGQEGPSPGVVLAAGGPAVGDPGRGVPDAAAAARLPWPRAAVPSASPPRRRSGSTRSPSGRSPSTPRWSSDRQILPRTVADGVTDPVHVREWTGRALFLLEQGPSQVRKGCRV